ncbi:hypothetical protein GGI43DRAFT_403022 [Trichoderma evansii]
MLEALSWSAWSGYKDFNTKMGLVAKHTEEKKLYHSPTATQVVVSMALVKTRQVNTKDDGTLHNSIRKYRVYDLALSTIHHYERYPNQIGSFNRGAVEE